jgi:hypothetical protein
VGQPSAHLLHGSPVENMQPILLHADEKKVPIKFCSLLHQQSNPSVDLDPVAMATSLPTHFPTA